MVFLEDISMMLQMSMAVLLHILALGCVSSFSVGTPGSAHRVPLALHETKVSAVDGYGCRGVRVGTRITHALQSVAL